MDLAVDQVFQFLRRYPVQVGRFQLLLDDGLRRVIAVSPATLDRVSRRVTVTLFVKQDADQRTRSGSATRVRCPSLLFASSVETLFQISDSMIAGC